MPRPVNAVLWTAAVGLLCIVGGEALCILGPLRYEHQIHLICHAIFYAGVVLVAIAWLLHWKSRQ